MGDAATSNGDMISQSVTFQHIASYPTVKSLTDAIQKDKVGSKSIELTSAVYERISATLQPLLETPASYAKPYALKIDEFGNFFLDKVDERIPILKSETEEVKSTIVGYINYVPEKAGEAKKKVLDTYNDEYKKCGGDGYVAGGKALITSSLVLTSEGLAWLSSFLSQKTDEAKEYAKKAEAQGKDWAKKAESEVYKLGGQLKDQANKTEGEVKDQAKKAEGEVKEQTNN